MIEHDHSHVHQKVHSWAELTIAGCAILISLISLVVSIRHGHTMEKLVEANEKQVKASTLPLPRFGTGNLEDNIPAVQFHITNGGTGPAIIYWFRISWDGTPTKGPRDLLDRCCSKGKHLSLSSYQDLISGMTLPAGRSQTIWSIPKAHNDPQVWRILENDARGRIIAEACYCSVLEECWITRFDSNPPRTVKLCDSINAAERW